MTQAPYSPFRQVEGWTSFSGLIGRKDGVDGVGLEEQLTLIFEQLDARLAEAGLAKHNIVKTTVLLADIDDWAAMNGPYLDYFSDVEALPSRSAFGVGLPGGLLVEIEVWAHANA